MSQGYSCVHETCSADRTVLTSA